MSKSKPKTARLRASGTSVGLARMRVSPKKTATTPAAYVVDGTESYAAWLKAELENIAKGIRTDIPDSSAAAPDLVNHPPHYMRGGVECIDIVEAMATGWSPQTALRLGQAVQYIFRHAHKGEAVRDLQKAVFWIQREIDALETQGRAS